MNKYHNKPTTVDGITFDSKKEANRYAELKLMQKAGEIRDLKLQPEFILQEAFEIGIFGTNKKKKIQPIKYIADFQYFDNEKQILTVEDVKSVATMTQAYRIKRKMFLKKYPQYLFREYV